MKCCVCHNDSKFIYFDIDENPLCATCISLNSETDVSVDVYLTKDCDGTLGLYYGKEGKPDFSEFSDGSAGYGCEGNGKSIFVKQSDIAAIVPKTIRDYIPINSCKAIVVCWKMA